MQIRIVRQSRNQSFGGLAYRNVPVQEVAQSKVDASGYLQEGEAISKWAKVRDL
jgi:hypothetical protein